MPPFFFINCNRCNGGLYLSGIIVADAVSKLFTSYMRASPADIEDILLCMDRVVQSARYIILL